MVLQKYFLVLPSQLLKSRILLKVQTSESLPWLHSWKLEEKVLAIPLVTGVLYELMVGLREWILSLK